MRVRLSTVLDVPAASAWDAVLKPRLLDHVAWPLQVFEPVDPPAMPARWVDGRYLVRPRMFGFIPMGRQWIVISMPETGPIRFRLRDDGHGTLASRWDHLITIDPIDADRCRYTDEVEVRAGVLTAFVWAFAVVFYLHRQRRWRKLVASKFAPLEEAVRA